MTGEYVGVGRPAPTAPRARDRRRRSHRATRVGDGGTARETRGVDEARAFPSETLQRERDDRAEEWHDGARDDHGCARDFSKRDDGDATRAREGRGKRASVRLVVVGGDGVERRARLARRVGGREGRRSRDEFATARRRRRRETRDARHATRARDARDARSTDDGVILVPCFQRAQAWT